MASENKRIAKNTVFLYIRSFLMMAINLYASRIILQALGVEDYGLYGAIGSIVAMFTIINGSLSSGTSRFLTFELGRGDMAKLKKTFNASLAMHIYYCRVSMIGISHCACPILCCKRQERGRDGNGCIQRSQA